MIKNVNKEFEKKDDVYKYNEIVQQGDPGN